MPDTTSRRQIAEQFRCAADEVDRYASTDMPTVFEWDITAEHQEGLGGVSVDRGRAISAFSQALREAPPCTQGVLSEVALSSMGGGYVLVRVVARAEVDETTGLVVWADR
jgi:hypothetical protein